MDALFLSYVARIIKHENYLISLKAVKYFRRNKILIEKKQIEIALNELTEIRPWMHNFAMLVKKDARKYSNICALLIKKLEKLHAKFARRIEVFEEDDIATDSYDDEFGNDTASSSEI